MPTAANFIFKRTAGENVEGEEACPLELADYSCLTTNCKTQRLTTISIYFPPFFCRSVGDLAELIWAQLDSAPGFEWGLDLLCAFLSSPDLELLRAHPSHKRRQMT